MINKDTILSVYTDKQTLLEYLTAIEKALNKAVLVSADIVDEGSNKCHFVFTFEDDTKVITPTIEFIKPVKAATISNGVLYLTLADGTKVSAGSITASFGASTFTGDVLVHGNFHQTDGATILGGNAEVDGNLNVNGTIKQVSYELDTDIAISGLPTNLNCNYAHARVSNGKLNIVLSLYSLASTAVAESTINTNIGSITIPNSAGSMLYPFDTDVLERKRVVIGVGTSPNIYYAEVSVIKVSNTAIRFYLSYFSSIPSTFAISRCARFEFNFVLS